MKPAERHHPLSPAASAALVLVAAGLLVVAAWSSGGEPLVGHSRRHSSGDGGFAQAVLVGMLALLAGGATLAVAVGARRRSRDPA